MAAEHLCEHHNHYQQSTTTEHLINNGMQWVLTAQSVDSHEQLKQVQRHQVALQHDINHRQQQQQRINHKRSADMDMHISTFRQQRQREEQQLLPTWAQFGSISSSEQQHHNPQYPQQLVSAMAKQPRRSDASAFSGRLARAAQYQGSYGEDQQYVAEGIEVGQGRGLLATQFIAMGTQVTRYGMGQPLSQREKEMAEQQHHTNNWYQATGGQHPTFIDGTGTLAALINHACGKHPACPANVQIQRDGDQYWVTAIRDIQPGEFLHMDYNFPVSERDLDTPDQQWWRDYLCPNCQPLNVGRVMPQPAIAVPMPNQGFHMGVAGGAEGRWHGRHGQRSKESKQRQKDKMWNKKNK